MRLQIRVSIGPPRGQSNGPDPGEGPRGAGLGHAPSPRVPASSQTGDKAPDAPGRWLSKEHDAAMALQEDPMKTRTRVRSGGTLSDI